jgi:hypothetical protein
VNAKRQLREEQSFTRSSCIQHAQFHKPHDQITDQIQPFLDRYPKNSSWEIASTLPALIPASSGNPTPIHIHVHHEPIRVAYKDVVEMVSKLLTTTPTPDIVLHIGLAASRKFFAIEQGAHSRGYGKTNDVDGEQFLDSEAQSTFPDSAYPSVLHTGFDTEDVLSRWRTSLGQCPELLDHHTPHTSAMTHLHIHTAAKTETELASLNDIKLCPLIKPL